MKSIEVLMIPVKDSQKAKEFYLKLGFQIVIEATDPHGDAWIQMGLPNSDATISLASFQGIICETENIEEEIKNLESKGIEVGKIDDTPWGRFAWKWFVSSSKIICQNTVACNSSSGLLFPKGMESPLVIARLQNHQRSLPCFFGEHPTAAVAFGLVNEHQETIISFC